MNRDEVLSLILLEADGGLGMKEAEQLREALRGEPELEQTRQEIHASWKDVQGLASGLGLPKDFGEVDLDSLMRSRPEGVLVSFPIRVAAAFLLLATLWRAIAGPLPVASLRNLASAAGAGRIEAERIEDRQSVHTGQWVSASAENSVQVKTRAGAEIDLEEGAIGLLSDREIATQATATRATVSVGARATQVHLPGATVVSRDARFRLRITPTDTKGNVSVGLQVEEGLVHFGSLRGRVMRPSDGEVVWTKPDGIRVLPDPARGRQPSRGPEIDPDPHRTPMQPVPEELPSLPEAPAPQPAPENSSREARSEAILAGTVSGQLNGLPVAAVRVVLTPIAHSQHPLPILGNDSAMRLESFSDAVSELPLPGPAIAAVTDEAGRFLVMAPVGTYRVEAQVPSSQLEHADAPDHWVHLEHAREYSLSIDLPLGGQLWGRVVDDRGVAISHAQVRRGPRVAFTDKGGTYRLPGVATSGATLQVMADGFVPRSFRVSGNDYSLFQLHRAEPLRGYLRHAQGQQIEGWIRARWQQQEVVFERAVDGVDSVFELKDLPSDVEIRLLAGAHGCKPVESTLPAGWPRGQTLVVDLEPVGNSHFRNKGVLVGDGAGSGNSCAAPDSFVVAQLRSMTELVVGTTGGEIRSVPGDLEAGDSFGQGTLGAPAGSGEPAHSAQGARANGTLQNDEPMAAHSVMRELQVILLTYPDRDSAFAVTRPKP